MSITGKHTGTRIYDALAQRIRKSILQGDLKPGEWIGSEHDLARQASISRMSVRKASEILLEEGLIERRPGKGLFVRENHVATRTVQVVVPDLEYDQCVQIVRGAKKAGAERGVRVQVYDAHGSMELDIQVLRSLPRTCPQGAIIASWHHPRFAEVLYELKTQNYPFVLVDERLKDIEIPSVVADNYGGGYRAGKELIGLGHRRIAFIGNLVADTVRARLEGLRDAIADAGLPFDRSLVCDLQVEPTGDWQAAIDRCTRQILSRSDRPSAIFFSNDAVAADAYRTLRSMKVRIPQQLSVVGFDDDPMCQYLEPTLTTVRQPSTQLGEAAMEMLLQRIANPRLVVENRVLPTTWVRRESVAGFTSEVLCLET